MTDVDGNRDSELNLWRCAGLASPECSPFDLRDFAMSMPIRGLVFFLCLTGIAVYAALGSKVTVSGNTAWN